VSGRRDLVALPEVVAKEGVNSTHSTSKGNAFAWVNHPENRAMTKAHQDERDARAPHAALGIRRAQLMEAWGAFHGRANGGTS
jgi:hypothetical protein